MNPIKRVGRWLGDKFEAWLQKVGKENRPDEHDYNTLSEDKSLSQRADLMPDERGFW